MGTTLPQLDGEFPSPVQCNAGVKLTCSIPRSAQIMLNWVVSSQPRPARSQVRNTVSSLPAMLTED